MAQELRVDADRLHAVMQEYESIGEAARRAHDELRAVLAAEGDCWGEDTPGRSFAETYVPDARNLLDSLSKTLGSLTTEGNLLGDIAKRVNNADELGRSSVLGAMPDREYGSGIEPYSAAAPPNTTPSSVAQTPGSARPSQPVVGPGAYAGQNSAYAGQNGTPSNGERAAGVGQPASNPPGATSNNTPATSGDSQTTGRSDSPAPSTNGAQPPSGALPPDTGRRPSREAAANGTSGKSDGVRAAEPARPNTPWSRSPGAAPTGPSAPRRVSAPSNRPGESHGARPNSPSAPKAPPGKTAPRKAVSASQARPRREDKQQKVRLATPDEARELAEALMERHGLRVLGFETPGIGLDVLREIAAALDDVLTAYPYLALPKFAIAECGEAVTRLERSRHAGGSGPLLAGLTLNVAFAKDAAALAEKVTSEIRRGKISRGSENRPVYSTIVRQLGHALDISGGLAAHAVSQRTMISEYLSECGESRLETPLGAIVRGYLTWRDGLSRYGFPNGRFEPGMALADAFVEVQMNPADAGAPARVLHRLLVETARRHSPKDYIREQV
ncbi:hypothetical protein [Nocardia africana]|nr:hypothetical protein [Nocardia africana]MCC3315241.1 hypothetical protein [Nocardia africana]